MRSRLMIIVAVPIIPCLLLLQPPSVPKVPDGFTVELVLEAPDIEAPTALAVAPNGDVYFAEDPMDMRGPTTTPIDKIWCLKNGDPKRRVLVADKMWAVMGLEFVGNKLYVVHPPFVTVFTLGADGKPVKREDLFDDLGPKLAGLPSFNDHVPSGIRMGMDGWLYVSVGDKGIPKMTRKEKGRGSVHVAEGRWRHTEEGNHISLEGGGVIRFRPDGSLLEVFASGTRNHLDVPMDEHDRIFVRDNTNDGGGWNTRLMYLPRGAFMGYPWAFTKHPEETLPAIHDFGGGSPCGGWVYCDDGLPEKYRGRIFHCEWGKGKVYAVKVKEKGAGFEFVDEITFMDPDGTKVKDFRPFSIRPTADGRGFYVTDWGYSGWSANVKAGRLWKVTYTKDDVKPAPRGKDSDGVEQLVEALDHPAHSERLRAQRTLIARGPDAAAKLMDAWRKDALSPAARRHAAWVLAQSGNLAWADAHFAMLAHPDATVRREAVRVMNDHLVGGDFERVARRNAAVTAAFTKDTDAWVRLFAAGSLLHPVNGRISLPALAAEGDPAVRHAIARWLQYPGTDWTGVDEVLAKTPTLRQRPEFGVRLARALAELDDPKCIDVLRRLAADPSPDVREAAVVALSRSAKHRPPYAGAWWGTRPEQNPPPPRTVTWDGTGTIRDSLIALLNDPDAAVRQAAVDGLSQLRDPESFAPLVKRFDAEKDDAARAAIVKVIGTIPGNDAIAFLAAKALSRQFPLDIRLAANQGLHGRKEPAAVEALIAVASNPVGFRDHATALSGLTPHKSAKARPVIEKSLEPANPHVKEMAIRALAAYGDEAAGKLITPELDSQCQAPRAAAEAVAALKYRPAIPELVKLSASPDFQDDAIRALSAMPDVRALPAYLTGLRSKNPAMRQAARGAIAAIRDKAAPVLEQLAQRKELPAEVLGELNSVYAAFAPIIEWRIIGPFPNDGTEPPAVKEAKYATWRPVKAKPRTGEVNLTSLFDPNTNVGVYAYAEVESSKARAATLSVGSDDTMAVWVNGEKVFGFDGNRGWSPDQDKAPVKLKAGKNAVLIRCGNASGPWGFSVGVSGETDQYKFLQGAPAKLDLAAFRELAAKNRGDAERGRTLFLDTKGFGCVKCHSVAMQGGTVGPAIDGVALKYSRDDLMTSILEPSKNIASGYETVVITTNAGKQLSGVFKGESGDAVRLADMEGKLIVVPKSDIDEKTFSPVSMMPNGLNEGMALQDFADLIAYLEARREEKPK